VRPAEANRSERVGAVPPRAAAEDPVGVQGIGNVSGRSTTKSARLSRNLPPTARADHADGGDDRPLRAVFAARSAARAPPLHLGIASQDAEVRALRIDEHAVACVSAHASRRDRPDRGPGPLPHRSADRARRGSTARVDRSPGPSVRGLQDDPRENLGPVPSASGDVRPIRPGRLEGTVASQVDFGGVPRRRSREPLRMLTTAAARDPRGSASG
jgi:hypothetical protein